MNASGDREARSAPGPFEARFALNGGQVTVRADPMTRLLDVLREELELTGTKEGCGEGECGSCTVLLDGEPVCACLVPLAQVGGRAVTTVEGLERGPAAAGTGEDPLQRELTLAGGVQCGACTPGILVAARALLDRHPRPTREQVREGLAGNLCRCTGYERILSAVLRVAGSEDEEGSR